MHALKLAGSGDYRVQDLIARNQELIIDIEVLRERLAQFESSGDRDFANKAPMNYKIRKDTSLESISAANLMILNEVGRPAGAVIET